VVVGGSKTTDEEMLKSAREVVYDEKIAYLENVSGCFSIVFMLTKYPDFFISFLIFCISRTHQSFLVRYLLSWGHYIAIINSKTTMN